MSLALCFTEEATITNFSFASDTRLTTREFTFCLLRCCMSRFFPIRLFARRRHSCTYFGSGFLVFSKLLPAPWLNSGEIPPQKEWINEPTINMKSERVAPLLQSNNRFEHHEAWNTTELHYKACPGLRELSLNLPLLADLLSISRLHYWLRSMKKFQDAVTFTFESCQPPLGCLWIPCIRALQ